MFQCLLSTILQIYVSLMLKNNWKAAYQKIQHKDTSRNIQNDCCHSSLAKLHGSTLTLL